MLRSLQALLRVCMSVFMPLFMQQVSLNVWMHSAQVCCDRMHAVCVCWVCVVFVCAGSVCLRTHTHKNAYVLQVVCQCMSVVCVCASACCSDRAVWRLAGCRFVAHSDDHLISCHRQWKIGGTEPTVAHTNTCMHTHMHSESYLLFFLLIFFFLAHSILFFSLCVAVSFSPSLSLTQ